MLYIVCDFILIILALCRFLISNVAVLIFNIYKISITVFTKGYINLSSLLSQDFINNVLWFLKHALIIQPRTFIFFVWLHRKS